MRFFMERATSLPHSRILHLYYLKLNLVQKQRSLHLPNRVSGQNKASCAVWMFVYLDIKMKTSLMTAAAVCALMFTGCATTQKIANKVNIGGSDTPLAQVLKERDDLRKELSTVEIRQYFNTVESPTAAEVKVTETGLLDDSVKSVRTVYNFKLVDGDWEKTATKTSYQCARGKNTKNFQTAKCA